jgi:hypothetical protein
MPLPTNFRWKVGEGYEDSENYYPMKVPDYVFANKVSISKWLNENIGEYNVDYAVTISRDVDRFILFSSQEDRSLFRLVWISAENEAKS